MNEKQKEAIRNEIGNWIEPILSTSITALAMKLICKKPMSKEQILYSTIAHRTGNALGRLPSNTVPLSYNKSIGKCPMKTEELVAISLALGYNNSISRKRIK